MAEPIKIEPYYQTQGKEVMDCLFDKGILSESLSRDGMDAIEELLAYYLQSASETAARTATLTKKYKVLPGGVKGEPGHERHEEEMRWIARAKEAEALVASLSIAKGKLWARVEKAEARVAELEEIIQNFEPKWPPSWEKAPGWAREVCAFLRTALLQKPGHSFNLAEGRRLFDAAIELGIIPEPDCRPGKEWQIKPGDGCACPPVPESSICPKCGGRKI